MAVQGPAIPIPGATAGEDLSAKQFHFVAIDPAGAKLEFIAPTAAGDPAHGVLCNTPISGQAAEVQSLDGTVGKVKIGSAVTAGDKLYTDNTGLAVTAATGSGFALATALETVSVTGTVISAILGAQAIV